MIRSIKQSTITPTINGSDTIFRRKNLSAIQRSLILPSLNANKSKPVLSMSKPLHVSRVESFELSKPQKRTLITCKAYEADRSEPIEASEVKSEAAKRVKIGIYFATWWALNVVFNIYNKKVLNAFPYPWLTSTLSLACGSLMMMISWATRIAEAPNTDFEFWKTLFPVAVAHTIGHVAATVSMSKVAVSFTHIIKSGEPAFSVLVSRFLLGETFPPSVYMSLVPIIGGCALAAVTELNFNMIGHGDLTFYDISVIKVNYLGLERDLNNFALLGCLQNYELSCWPSISGFMGAMISNLAFVFRNIFSKRGMKGKSVSGMNYYACLSILSLFILTPFAIAVEGPQVWAAGWQTALSQIGPNFIWWLAAQSVFYHLYNQVSYMSLNEISPLTFSIGNTMKRISVIVSSIIIFHTPVQPINALGAAIAILGTFLYSQIREIFYLHHVPNVMFSHRYQVVENIILPLSFRNLVCNLVGTRVRASKHINKLIFGGVDGVRCHPPNLIADHLGRALQSSKCTRQGNFKTFRVIYKERESMSTIGGLQLRVGERVNNYLCISWNHFQIQNFVKRSLLK
ncbi:hypothetical protein POTOM_041248 [Populus tomentosa]|uniref:Sugar phosphate transporter domain-containing protein n=1 Tax=Populus tomentosa TaxID=118781 RepID=A0A8X7Z270_POPTO|nr:hypothetical protein POTOM_041248 [Populus tomentosa]